jgi:Ca2+-binding RTX toxin-like protein
MPAGSIGPNGGGDDDVVFGDHGAVIQQVIDPNLPDVRLQKIQTTRISSIRAIESRAYQNGNDDTIFGNRDRDVLVGGAGHDMIDGDEADDLIFGDQVFLLRRLLGADTGTDITAQQDITSGRFETLCGWLLYSRSDRTSCGITGGENTSGALLTDGTTRDFRTRTARRGGPNTRSPPRTVMRTTTHDLPTTDRGPGRLGNDYSPAGPRTTDLRPDGTTSCRATAASSPRSRARSIRRRPPTSARHAPPTAA